MRQQEDPDCRIVARDLFAGLVSGVACWHASSGIGHRAVGRARAMFVSN